MGKPKNTRFETLSGIELKTFYGPEDLPHFEDFSSETKKELVEWRRKYLGRPGEFPYPRGIYEEGYRKQLPTIRQFCGERTAPYTNELLHYLIGLGEKGLSVAYDAVTLHGRDSDSEDWSLGYVGKDGVAVDTLDDFHDLLKGISLEKYSLSQTINFPAIVFFSMYLAEAKAQEIPAKKLRGTIQSDILKEVIKQKEYRFPLKHGLRLMGDMMEYSIMNLNFGFYPDNASGYHMSEGGASASQELAFTLKNAFAFIEYCLERGMNANDVMGRVSLFFNCKGTWEDIAKFRAARRIWATVGKEKYGAASYRALALKFHVQNSGASFRSEEARNNIQRGTLQCLAALLGGAQSVHINSWNETSSLPTREAVKVSVRTQQIVGEEMHNMDIVDVLGGSFAIEALTWEMEKRATDYFKAIDEMGGMLKAIELGYPQFEIRKTSLEEAQRMKNGKIPVVGVNTHSGEAGGDSQDDNEFRRIITLEVHEEQKKRLAKVKKERDQSRVARSLERLSSEAKGNANLVEPVLEAVEARATVEEIMIKTLEPVFGRWRGPGD
ncbi:methylmalonyl-CoA mutase [Candidatus Giovannonibacteria bacterium]|nr:methylmalonyl-CoA mutase [Candidatus Giovannonibacteria bacterium]